MADPVDWTTPSVDRLDVVKRMVEAGLPDHAIASVTGFKPEAIEKYKATYKWDAPQALKDACREAIENAIEKRIEVARKNTALEISADEAEELRKVLGARDLTVPERSSQYEALMGRFAMRVGVLALTLSDDDLIKHSSDIERLDKVARRALDSMPGLNKGGPAPGVPAPKVENRVSVTLMPGPLPPLLSAEQQLAIAGEQTHFANGGLPPIKQAKAVEVLPEK